MVEYLNIEPCDDLDDWTYTLDLSLATDRQEGDYSVQFNASEPGNASPSTFNASTWPVGYKVWGFWWRLRTNAISTDDILIKLRDTGNNHFVGWWFYPQSQGYWVYEAIALGSTEQTYSTSVIDANDWHWFEVEWIDSTHMKFYKNGALFFSTTTADVDLGSTLSISVTVSSGKTCPPSNIDYIVSASTIQYPPEYSETFPPYLPGGTAEKVYLEVHRGSTLIYSTPYQDNDELEKTEIFLSLNEVDIAKCRLDNEKLLDIQAGDNLKIWIDSEGEGTMTLSFNGEIIEATQVREEAMPFLDISAKGWSKILEENDITLSYPIATNASTICKGIVESVTDDSPEDWEHLITIYDVEETDKTRTLDFEGISMLEALKKLSQVTAFDFYVDAEKDLNFFARGSRSSGKTLTSSDLQDYDYSKKRQICNWAKVFGAPIKTYPDPWELCLLTESIDGWSIEGYYDGGTAIPCTIDLDSNFKKCGNYCVSFNPTSVSGARAEEIFIASYDFSNTIDLSLKESYTALRFSTILYSLPTSGDNARRESFDVYLIDSGGNTISFPAGDKSINWWQGDFIKESGTSTVVWQDFNIAVGGAEEGGGKWEKLNDNFDWSTVVTIRFRFAVTTRAGTTPDIIYGFIDWLHFAEGRFTGEYKLEDSDPDVTAYGRSYGEFFDESAYSESDCYMQAKSYVQLYKAPVDWLENVEIDYQGMETLNVGEKVGFDLPEGAFTLRIIGITWTWDGDLYGKLDLSSTIGI